MSYRMQYHLMSDKGWLNDPNGLCYYQGKYYVYFQYAPNYPHDNLKKWGCYTSNDLINWTFEGMKLDADCGLDKSGAYSGCAFVEDEQMHIFYTGNVKLDGNYDYINEGRIANTIYINANDYKNKQLLLSNKDYPSDCTCHVRDPKVWKKQDTYFMILGARKQNNQGCVLLYQSDDLYRWRYVQTIVSKEKFGYMWECPDYFTINNKQLLSCCPQGVNACYDKYQNIYQAGYFLVEGEISSNYQLVSFNEWDYGFDFYAPQSFVDNKGRRIMFGWAGLPDAPYDYLEQDEGWIHALSLPREVKVINDKIYTYPVEEIKQLRKKEVDVNTFDLNCKAYELQVDSNIKQMHLKLGKGINISYDGDYFKLKFNEEVGAKRDVRYLKVKELSKVNLFIDNSIIEIYINDGEYVMTSRCYSETYEPYITEEHLEVRIWEF